MHWTSGLNLDVFKIKLNMLEIKSVLGSIDLYYKLLCCLGACCYLLCPDDGDDNDKNHSNNDDGCIGGIFGRRIW